ncbi:MAG: hypothetical protein AAFV53_03655 [Myxococcota bacterium]
MFPLLLTLACASPDDDPSTQVDSDVEEDVVLNFPPEDELFGRYPDEPLSAPAFTAVNDDGAARDREDLLGEPTVMWFFPAAGTAD